MTDKLCPFISRPVFISPRFGCDGEALEAVHELNMGFVTCKKDGCMAWYEAGQCCHLIHCREVK